VGSALPEPSDARDTALKFDLALRIAGKRLKHYGVAPLKAPLRRLSKALAEYWWDEPGVRNRILTWLGGLSTRHSVGFAHSSAVPALQERNYDEKFSFGVTGSQLSSLVLRRRRP